MVEAGGPCAAQLQSPHTDVWQPVDAPASWKVVVGLVRWHAEQRLCVSTPAESAATAVPVACLCSAEKFDAGAGAAAVTTCMAAARAAAAAASAAGDTSCAIAMSSAAEGAAAVRRLEASAADAPAAVADHP